MSTNQTSSNSSLPSENRQDESQQYQSLKPVDFPNLSLDTFLRIMRAYSELSFEKVEHNYYRFQFANQNPVDPEAFTVPILAAGGNVAREQVWRVFERFHLSIYRLREELSKLPKVE